MKTSFNKITSAVYSVGLALSLALLVPTTLTNAQEPRGMKPVSYEQMVNLGTNDLGNGSQTAGLTNVAVENLWATGVTNFAVAVGPMQSFVATNVGFYVLPGKDAVFTLDYFSRGHSGVTNSWAFVFEPSADGVTYWSKTPAVLNDWLFLVTNNVAVAGRGQAVVKIPSARLAGFAAFRLAVATNMTGVVITNGPGAVRWQ